MVNEVILNYLNSYKDKYKLEDLKKEILAKGYSEADFDEVVSSLGLNKDSSIQKIEPKKFEPASFNRLPSSNYVGNEDKNKFGVLKFVLIILLIILTGCGIIVVLNYFGIPFFNWNLFDYFK